MVRRLDGEMPTKMRMDLATRTRLAGLRLLIDRRQTQSWPSAGGRDDGHCASHCDAMPRHMTRAGPPRLQEPSSVRRINLGVASLLHRGSAIERRAAEPTPVRSAAQSRAE